ncbi:hypothetical protein GEMRC1_011492 [Eukaryota sp. GEM-RC1]
MISPQFITRCLKSHGLHISSDVSETIARDVEFRLLDIIQDVSRVSKSLKRPKLTVSDLNSVLEMRRLDGIYGRFFGKSVKFHTVRDLLYEADGRLHVDSVLVSESRGSLDLTPIPTSPSLLVNWLVVEGKQVQGPLAPTRSVSTPPQDILSSATTDSRGVPVVLPIRHTLSRELNEFYARLLICLKSESLELRKSALTSLKGDTGLHQLLPYICYSVSELITQYLVQQDGSQKNSSDFPHLPALIATFTALGQSRFLVLDNYLHYICPSLISIMVCTSLPTVTQEDFQGFLHLSVSFDDSVIDSSTGDLVLRHLAAECLSLIVIKYAKKYPEVLEKTLSLFLQYLEKDLVIDSVEVICYCVVRIAGDNGLKLVLPLMEKYAPLPERIRDVILIGLGSIRDCKLYDLLNELFLTVTVPPSDESEMIL